MNDPFGYRTTSNLVEYKELQSPKVEKLAIPFQPDAVEVELRRLPFSAHFALYFVLSLLITAIVWAWWAQVDRTVSARGKLVSQSRMIVKQPLRPSVIRSLNVRAGDFVQKGDVVASLDPTNTKADEGQLRSRIILLEAELARLDAEQAGAEFMPEDTQNPFYILQLDLFKQRRAGYQAALDGFAAKKKTLSSQGSMAHAQEVQIDAQLELARRKLKTVTSLVKKKSVAKVKKHEAQAEVSRLEAAKLEKSEEQLKFQLERESLDVERRQFLSEKTRQNADRRLSVITEMGQLEFELQKALRVSDFDTFSAESDGIIMDVTRKSVGSIVEAAEMLFTLVPIEDGLDVELELSARDIGWVHVGQAVRIKLDPFPFQRHGTLEGRLSSISPDAFQKQTGGQTQVFYQVRVSIDDNKLRNLPNDFKLLPGITSTAEIKIGKRTVLSYITDPFHSALDESLKEPN